MSDLTALGELLIDFTEYGVSADGQRLFEQNPGGAPANVVCAASKLGIKTAFIGKVGDDLNGRFLAETLRQNGVDTRGLIVSRDVSTTLAFVALSSSGEREFSFLRKPGADTCLTPEEVDADLIRQSKIFHVGSLSLTDEPARSATKKAVCTAKESGVCLSYDPNYRSRLWGSVEEAKKQMRSLLPFANIVKISLEETELIADTGSPLHAVDELLRQGVNIAIVTLGKDGAMIGYQNNRFVIPANQKGTVIDTTGAGDSFFGAFLARMIKEEDVNSPDPCRMKEHVYFANTAAMLCIGKRGAIPALPTLTQIQDNAKTLLV